MRPDLLPRFYLFDFIFSQRTIIDKNHLNVNGAFYCSSVKRPQMLYMMIRNFQTASLVILSFLQFDSALGCFPGRLGKLSIIKHMCNGFYCQYNVVNVIVILIEVVITRFQIMVSHV